MTNENVGYATCPVEATLGLIQGKWKVVILFRLKGEERRFGELLRLLPGVTQRMLTNQLRDLEQDGLVHRKVYAEVPPKVVYSLTDLALSLMPVMLSIKEWGRSYLDKQEMSCGE